MLLTFKNRRQWSFDCKIAQTMINEHRSLKSLALRCYSKSTFSKLAIVARIQFMAITWWTICPARTVGNLRLFSDIAPSCIFLLRRSRFIYVSRSSILNEFTRQLSLSIKVMLQPVKSISHIPLISIISRCLQVVR